MLEVIGDSMKQKTVINKIFFILLFLGLMSGILLFHFYFKVQGDLFRNAYHDKQQILEDNTATYIIEKANIKSIERNIPIFTVSTPLMTNERYDRIVFDNGKSFIIKNRDCKLTENNQSITIIQNKNKERESYIFPDRKNPDFESLFLFGKDYQNYLNDQQIIIDCSAIPYNPVDKK